jgi:soluble lytic murein transglycosylase-like protein
VRSRRHFFASSIVLAAAALSTGVASAQVFEVTDGAIRRVDAAGTRASAASPAPPRVAAMVEAAAARYGLAPELLDTVARQESDYRADAISPAGAIGIMQLMPATARSFGVDPHDPAASLNAGAAYLRAQLDRFDGRIDLALAAYNAGPAAVARYAGVPPYRETRAYVAAGLSRLASHNLTAPSTLETSDQP